MSSLSSRSSRSCVEWMMEHVTSVEQLDEIRDLMADRVPTRTPGAGTRSTRARSSRVFRARLRSLLLESEQGVEDEAQLDAQMSQLLGVLESLHSRAAAYALTDGWERALLLGRGGRGLRRRGSGADADDGYDNDKRRRRSGGPGGRAGEPAAAGIPPVLGVIALVVTVWAVVWIVRAYASQSGAAPRSRSDVVAPLVASFTGVHGEFSVLAAKLGEALMLHDGRRAMGIHIAVTNRSESLAVGLDLVAAIENYVHFTRHPDSLAGGPHNGRGCRAAGGSLSMCRLVRLSGPGGSSGSKAAQGASVLSQVTDALMLHERTLFVLDTTDPAVSAFDVNSLVGSLLDDSLPYITTADGVRVTSSKAIIVILSDGASPTDAFHAAVQDAFAHGHAPMHRASDWVLRTAMSDKLGWDDRLVHRLSVTLPVVEDQHGYIRTWMRGRY